MNLNKRLKKIADYINHDDKVIDVGCDHAFLSIYLVLEKDVERVIASDINSGPLQIAVGNIKEYGLEDRVIAKLGDGLNPIEEDINTVIISGMGGITISEIISDKDKLKNINKIIISPNNEFYIARKTIVDTGYYISDEIMVKDKNKYYPIIIFEHGNIPYSEDDLTYGPILLKDKPIEFIEFYTFLRDTMISYFDKLTDDAKKKAILNEIKKLTNIING